MQTTLCIRTYKTRGKINRAYCPVLPVILLGQSGVGKTCLVKRFIHNRFAPWVTPPTIGMEYHATTCVGTSWRTSPVTPYVEDAVRLAIVHGGEWTIARPLLRTYTSKPCVVVLCLDIMGMDEGSDALLVQLRDLFPSPPHHPIMVHVAVCRYDTYDGSHTLIPVQRRVQTKLQDEVDALIPHHAQPLSFWFVSAKSGRNVESMWMHIIREWDRVFQWRHNDRTQHTPTPPSGWAAYLRSWLPW